MCRVVDLQAAAVPVGLGVDGVASNEVGGLFPELRQALYTARLREGRADALMPSDVVELATVGGAQCLGRPELGRLEVGAAADLAIWPGGDLGDIADPITALVMGPDRRVRHLFVAGEQRITDGHLNGVDMAAAHKRLAERSRRLWA
jgi:cytosine/adenosine deaminase-related metal-dependent hydrolase